MLFFMKQAPKCFYSYAKYKLSSVILTLWSNEFANGSGGRGSIPGRVIPKTLKMILDTSLINTPHGKVRKMGQG